MLGNWLPHKDYQENVIEKLSQIAKITPQSIREYKEEISKLYLLDLDCLKPIISPLYSHTGRKAEHQPEIFRPFVLMSSLKYYPDNWVEKLAHNTVLRTICGFGEKMPNIASYAPAPAGFPNPTLLGAGTAIMHTISTVTRDILSHATIKILNLTCRSICVSSKRGGTTALLPSFLSRSFVTYTLISKSNLSSLIPQAITTQHTSCCDTGTSMLSSLLTTETKLTTNILNIYRLILTAYHSVRLETRWLIGAFAAKTVAVSNGVVLTKLVKNRRLLALTVPLPITAELYTLNHNGICPFLLPLLALLLLGKISSSSALLPSGSTIVS
ncbi:MAG: hypothetical protein FWC97_11740 [Treponema sp.]|nr:hypothetical protein [Treponema sp.]